MFHRALGALALLCLLGGCASVPIGQGDNTHVDTWRGLDVREMVPPLELAAAANAVQREGRMLDGQGHAGGTFIVVPDDQLAFFCVHRIDTDEGILAGCTVQSGAPSRWTYSVYVSDRYPAWYRALIATHEAGHVGQHELRRALTHAGFGSPTVILIQRLGG